MPRKPPPPPPLGNKRAVGNRGGGSLPNDVIALAKTHTQAAIDTLYAIAIDPERKDSARVAAAEALLSRGHGSPKQTIEMSGEALERSRELEGVLLTILTQRDDA